MHKELTELKPIPADAPPETQIYAMQWNTLIAAAPQQFKTLLQIAYFKILQHYLLTRRAMPLAVLNRPLNKKWYALFSNYELPPVDLGTALQAASLSKTLPVKVTATARGGIMLLPLIVFETIVQRKFRNILLEQENPGKDKSQIAGYILDVPEDDDAVYAGDADGPLLNARGLERAYAPFVSSGEVTNNGTLTESSTPS